MKSLRRSVVYLAALSLLLTQLSTASVYLTQSAVTGNRQPTWTLSSTSQQIQKDQRYELRWMLKKRTAAAAVLSGKTAMAIPGYGVPEQIFVGGFYNFLNIYNLVITARILLSWFPQAQGIGFLQPVYAITDPYLNIFRGIIPPLFGLDFSPLLAFFLLSALTNATVAIGAEIPNKEINKNDLMMRFRMRQAHLTNPKPFALKGI